MIAARMRSSRQALFGSIAVFIILLLASQNRQVEEEPTPHPFEPSDDEPWRLSVGHRKSLQRTFFQDSGADVSHQYLSKTVVMGKRESEDTTWVEQEIPEWSPVIYTVDNPTASLRTPANKGNEAMAYLTYIIENYDDLRDITAFIHSHRAGYPEAWHIDNRAYDNTVSLNSLRIDYVRHVGYVNLRCNWDPGCPAETQPFRTGRNTKQEVLTQKAWMAFFPGVPIPLVIGAPCCSQFAVTKERIRQRSKDFWLTVRDWLLNAPEEDSDIYGQVLEPLWHILFGMELINCPRYRHCLCDLYGEC